MKLKLTIYHSTDAFGAGDWDTHHSGEFYFQYDFLKLTEAAKVNDANYRFLTFSWQGKPVGSAVLSSFILQLDLLAGSPRALKVIRKLSPRLLQTPVVCCGIPVSFGQNHFCVLDATFFNDMLIEVQQELEKFADEAKSSLLAWKEFPPGFKGSDFLQKTGFLKLNSLPDTAVAIEQKSAEDFLKTLRSPYRRKLKNLLNGFKDSVLEKKTLKGSIYLLEQQHIPNFYKGYLAVMQRTATKLEVYDQAFFELLQKQYYHHLKLLKIRGEKGDEISALLLEQNEILHFLLVSKPKACYSEALYPTLLQAITLYGVTRGFKKIKMGQTSYYSKMAAGAHLLPLNIYLKSKNKTVHFVLQQLGYKLFPETKITPVHFYKSYENIAQN